jgi:hypothetical protein
MNKLSTADRQQTNPTVTAISPSVQAGLASQEVDITGTGFTGATQVTFGGVNAYAMQVLSDTEIAAVAPQHANGPVDLVIDTPHGTATLPHGYTYTDPTDQNIWEEVTVGGLSGTIAAFNCPVETPYLANTGGDEVTGFEPSEVHDGLLESQNPQYYTDKNGQARGVVVNYVNADVSAHDIRPVLHCTNSPARGFTTTLTPGQPINGPAAPNPTSSPNSMDQLLPVVINNSNSYLKITNVWTTGTFDNDPNFVDGDRPQVGQVIAPGGRLAANLRFTATGETLHVRVSDDHGDVLETSVSGSSITSGFQAQWTCNRTAGTNLQCHPTTPHMMDSTIVGIENA